MTQYVYVDETKRTGYVLAAVTVTDPATARKAVRSLMLPRQSRLHMVRENPARKAQIVAAVLAMGVTATVYDAGRHHPSELAARQACLRALAADLGEQESLLTIEQDDGLIRHDNRTLNFAARATGRYDTLRYHHQRASAEPLLALPDVIAWCWTRGGSWRSQVNVIVKGERTV
jgi:hypothetical protein